MQNFIIGTAGHVDHGKTTLIKALTNIECDTHKEEKKRGITINLGFAHIKHPKGYNIGIVDVPGHKDFINTMIKGAAGINFVLFVIAADSGIMPQTKEHLQILNALGIRNGIIVLSKCDLVEHDILELAKEEVRELVQGTFLKDSAIYEISSKTGEGINELKHKVFDFIEQIKYTSNENNISTPFLMNTDRIFTLKGIGTVITGSSLSGTLKESDSLFLLPADAPSPCKIKSIQKYKNSSNIIYPGERAAINIANLKVNEAAKYTSISNVILKSSTRIDAVIHFFNNEKNKNDCRNYGSPLTVRLLHGSLNTIAKIHILFEKSHNQTTDDNQQSTDNRQYFVQIELKKACITKYGNRFIIRNSSDDKTIGFGIILDPSPLKHIKRTEKLRNHYNDLENNGFSGIINSELSKNRGIISFEEFALNQNMSINEIKAKYSDSKNFTTVNDSILVDKKIYKKYIKAIPNVLKRFHSKLPLSKTGLTTEAISNSLSAENLNSNTKLVEFILKQLENDNIVNQKSGSWVSSSYKPVISANLEKNINLIEKYILSFEMTVPLLNQLKEYAEKFNLSEKELFQIFKHLTGLKKLYFFEDSYIHSKIVNNCKNKLIDYLISNSNKGITVAEFRDLVDGNRKMCLLLLGIYDKEKITIRKGDYRYLKQNKHLDSQFS